MGENKVILTLKQELLAAENVLCTEYSFDLAEPNYIRCLEIIKNAPELQPQFEELLILLFQENKVSSEPIAYLMHTLKWPKIYEWAEQKLRNDPNPIAIGAPYENILKAFDNEWENREFYNSI